MKHFVSLGFLSILLSISQKSCEANPVLSVPMLSKAAMAIYKGIKNYAEKKNEGLMSEDTVAIMKTLKSMSSDHQEMKDRILSKIKNNLKNKITDRTDKFFKYVLGIQDVYKTFLKIYGREDEFEEPLYRDFAKEVTSFTMSPVTTQIEKMYYTLLKKDYVDDSVISILLKETTVLKILSFLSKFIKWMFKFF